MSFRVTRYSRRSAVIAAFLVTALTGCGDKPSNTTAQTPVTPTVTNADLLFYQEQEPGEEGSTVRYVISPKFLRIDSGIADDGYVLFDRQAQTVYSVSHSNQAVFAVMKQGLNGTLPVDIKITVEKSEATDVPHVQGQAVVKLLLKANAKTCVEIYAAPGLLRSAVVAIKEYKAVLAAQHASTLENTPKELRDPCFVAFDIFKSDEASQQGLIVREKQSDGKQRLLVDFKPGASVDAGLFVLPAGYKRQGQKTP